ncbi:hypothetical protein [Massilia sp. TN1-12]|uniref:hypothetical protein n=1 Tax=Massilia paldalensis TaxID=3377675 RepID=UPI003850F2C5
MENEVGIEEKNEEVKIDVTKVTEIKAGVYYRGKKVVKTYHESPHAVVFSLEGQRNISYKYSGDEFSNRVASLESLITLADKKFKNERFDLLNKCIVIILRRIFERCDQVELDKLLEDYKNQIDAHPGVKAIVGRGQGYCVWQNENGGIGYRISAKSEKIDFAIAEYTRIRSMAEALLSEKDRLKFNRRLAAALHGSFKLPSAANGLFLTLEKIVLGAIQNEVKLKLLVVTVGVAITLMLVAVFGYYKFEFPKFIHLSLISATGGVAGALISFLERSKTTVVNEGDHAVLIILSNVCRVLIGGLFGSIACAAANADLAFSLFKESKSALLILGVAAGFSERLIPDVLGSIVSSKTSDT